MKQTIKAHSSFFKNITKVFSGTAGAQLLGLALMPAITRLYTPEEFGIFSIILSLVMILVVPAAGRYFYAILIPRNIKVAAQIVVLCAFLTALWAALLLIFAFGISALDEKILVEMGIQPLHLYLIAPFVVVLSAFLILMSWMNRQEHFSIMAAGKIMQSGMLGVGQIIIALSGIATATGLILGAILGYLFGALVYALKLGRGFFSQFRPFTVTRMAFLMKKYQDFPKYAVPADMLDVLSRRLPYLIFGFAFSPAVVGFYALAERCVGAPAAMLGEAVGEVFRNKAAQDLRAHGNCSHIFSLTMVIMFFLAIIGFTIFAFIAPPVFSFVFGEEWREAGHYAAILAVVFAMSFVATPLKHVFYIFEKQKYPLYFQMSFLAVSSLALATGFVFDAIEPVLWVYSVSCGAMYLMYVFFAWRVAQGTQKKAAI